MVAAMPQGSDNQERPAHVKMPRRTIARTAAARTLGYLSTRGMGRALRHPHYALYAFFGWISTIGYWVQRIAIQWLAWDLTHSFAWLGIVALAEAVPVVLVMPVAGAVADRMDRLSMARRARSSELFVALLLAVVVLSGQITIGLLVALVAMAGTAQALWSPARMAVIPNLVPKEDVPAALAFGATLFHASHFIGPALAGYIIAVHGVGWAFIFNAATFVLALAMLFVVRLKRNEQRASVSTSVLTDLRDGLRFVRRHQAIAPLMVAGLMISVGLRSYRELMAGYADGVFAQGAEGLATMASVSGLGALIAAVTMAAYARTHRLADVLFWAMAANVAVQAAFALAPSFHLAVVAAGGLGFLVTSVGMSAQILLQNAVPGEKRGRVMSLWGVQFFGGPSLGAWAIGGLASVAGFRVAVLCITALIAAYLVVLGRRREQLRSLEQQGLDD